MKSATEPSAVFLDRDGTLIEEKHYLHEVKDVAVFPQTIPALKRLCEEGFPLFIVTNQSGVGRGYYPMSDVHAIHRHLETMFAPHGIRFHRIYIAPEAPDQPSRGRKPSPRFLLDAAREFGLDLSRSFMVGDKLVDLECGWNAGAHSILVRTGYGMEHEALLTPEQLERTWIAKDLEMAADLILKSRAGCASRR